MGVPGASYTLDLGATPRAIDSNGDVAGSYLDSNNASHGFLRSAGQTAVTVFDAPGGGTASDEGTYVQDMNSSATVVGWVADAQRVNHGFLRAANGDFTIFDVPGSSGTQPFGINDSGMVTGEFLDANQGAHGFVRAADGSLVTFDVPGAASSQYVGTIPARINTAGMVVGTFQDTHFVPHGFVRRTDGSLIILDAPGATQQPGNGTQAQDINDAGLVVGLLYGPLFNGTGHHSFVWDPAGNYTVFDPPAVGPPPQGNGGTGSSANAVNAAGQIAGTYTDPNLIMHGYIRNTDGTFVIIDDPNAPQTAMRSLGTMLTGMNATGAVVGAWFDDPWDASHAFLRQ